MVGVSRHRQGARAGSRSRDSSARHVGARDIPPLGARSGRRDSLGGGRRRHGTRPVVGTPAGRRRTLDPPSHCLDRLLERAR
jgi:hypothetical protein